MIEYFEAKADKIFVDEFSGKLEDFLAIEGGKMDGKDLGLRDYLSQNMKRLKSIARKHSISQDALSYPAPNVGGPVIPINIFDSVLRSIPDRSGFGLQTIHDTMQAVIGACKEHERLESRARFNPLHWFKKLLFGVLRIPFILIEATGFDVGKIENNVFGHFTKLVILVVLILIAMNWLEFSKDDIIRMIRKILLE